MILMMDELVETTQPSLITPRLRLRPFILSDAQAVKLWAGDYEIAANTLLIPHPYPDGLAEQWIASHPEEFSRGMSAHFAITLLDTEELCGAIGLTIDATNHLAEMGYWVGQPYWGKGYCTEAARTLLDYGFRILGLHRIQSTHFVDNPASGQVLKKIGMRWEGFRRQHIYKWGQFKDVYLYGMLRQDFLTSYLGNMVAQSMDAVTVSTDRDRLDVDMIHAFLCQTYWSHGIPRSVVEQAIQHSFCFGLYLSDFQIGFARVITDFATFAYLSDVFVIEEHRGKGYGQQLIHTILNHPQLQGLRKWSLVTKDAHLFYQSFGFQKLSHPEMHLEIYDPDIYMTQRSPNLKFQ